MSLSERAQDLADLAEISFLPHELFGETLVRPVADITPSYIA